MKRCRGVCTIAALGRGALIAGALHAGWAEDSLVIAARAALHEGDPAQALALVANHPDLEDFADVRGMCVEAAVAASAWDRAQRLLIAPDVTGDGASTAVGIDPRWAPAFVGRAWLLLGRVRAARASSVAEWDQAATCFARALEQPGASKLPSVDQVLVWLAQCLERAERSQVAARAAARVWEGWRRGALRHEAGLILARHRPQVADRIWRSIMNDAEVTDWHRSAAVDALCQYWLAQRPMSCVQLAEAELERAPEEWRRRFLRWQALAWAQLDPQHALTLLQALPERDEIIAQAIAACQQAVGETRDPVLDALTRGDDVALRDQAGQDPVALAVVLARGFQPADWLHQPVAATDLGRLVLAEALARQDEAGARELIDAVGEPWMDVAADARLGRLLPAAAGRLVLVAAHVSAQGARSAQAWAWLREQSHFPAACGMAWVHQARQLSGDQALAAWRHAVQVLPAEHPWLVHAVQVVTRPLVASSDPEELAQASAWLARVAWLGNDADHLKVRFLLAQVLLRRGLTADAESCLASLEQHADQRQQAAIAELRRRFTALR